MYGIGHHDFFNVFQEWQEETIEQIMGNPDVIASVNAVNQAKESAERIQAITRLMETLE